MSTGSILLINPNSNEETTAAMVEIARQHGGGHPVEGKTTAGVSPIITMPEALDEAAVAVARTPVLEHVRAVIVAAFGDPGLCQLKARLGMPVVGIAEAAILEAAAGGRRFGIATTTPALRTRIEQRVAALVPAERCVSIHMTSGDPVVVMSDPERLTQALAGAVGACVADGAEAVIIGGGPLARAAQQLKPHFDVPIIEPIVSAVRHTERLLSRDV